MSELPPTNPTDATRAVVPSKPALAPGVNSQVPLPNAPRPTGPGLTTGPAAFSPGVNPPLGAPMPRLRAIELAPARAVTSYKVSLPETTQLQETFPVTQVIASGFAAAIAITAAVMLFLKY